MRGLFCYWRLVAAVTISYTIFNLYIYLFMAPEVLVKYRKLGPGHYMYAMYDEEDVDGWRRKRVMVNYTKSCFSFLNYYNRSHHYFKPHYYERHVQLRVILLTFNRPGSLRKVLSSLQGLELDGHQAALEIWIDRATSGHVDKETLHVASDYCWERGASTVHVHGGHAGEYGQWVNAWKPGNGDVVDTAEILREYPSWGGDSREGPMCGLGETSSVGCRRETETLALFLSDDVNVSPYAYRWLRAAHVKYGRNPDILGYDLQDKDTMSSGVPRDITDVVFGHTLPGTSGFVPHPARWPEFQAWMEIRYQSNGYKPYIPEAPMYTQLYKDTQDKHTEDTMISMWMARFAADRKLITIFPNLPHLLDGSEVNLVSNRRGLGMYNKKRDNTGAALMTQWDNEAVSFPHTLQVYGYDGNMLTTITVL